MSTEDVTIEFTRDDDVLAADRLRLAVAGPDRSALILATLVMPTRIAVGGTELFHVANGHTPSPWRPLPLVGTAVTLPLAMHQAWLNGTGACPLGDTGLSIEFKRVTEGLRAKLPATGAEASAAYPAFIQATQRYGAAARAYLGERLSELADDPFVGEWMRGSDPWGLEREHKGGRRATD